MKPADLATACSSNRAEEIGYDVWGRYVIPQRLNLSEWGAMKKPRVIIGGRGCGKTMLLRFLSHDTAFSRSRTIVPKSNLEHIGVYWRADTQFTSLLDGRDQPEHLWQASFGHLCALVLGREVIRALQSVANSRVGVITLSNLAQLDFSALTTDHYAVPSKINDFSEFLEKLLFEFEHWINNVHAVDQPIFIPGVTFLMRLIKLVINQIYQLKSVVFYAYIDEYENLTITQQRIINTWLKHSEPPLIFNVAMKRNGFKVRTTLADESLVDTHDYRHIDLEDFANTSEFSKFAAEILLLRAHQARYFIKDFNPEILQDPDRVSIRQTSSYFKKCLIKQRCSYRLGQRKRC